MKFGNQNRYCPNCGKHLYDANLDMKNVKWLMCSAECRNEWEMKYARCVLGKDEPEILK